MSRQFVSSSAVLVLSPGNLVDLAGGPITVAVLWRPFNLGSGGIIDGRKAGTSVWSLSYDFDSKYHVNKNTSGYGTCVFGQWQLYAYTKASGDSPVRSHLYQYDTGVWTHTDHATAPDGIGPIDEIRIGRVGDEQSGHMSGRVAAVGVWGEALPDVQLETMTRTVAAWLAAEPTALWAFNQTEVLHTVVDLTGGGADQNNWGGEVDPVDPPLWSYDISGVRVIGTARAGFTTSTDGTLYTPPAEPAAAGDVDVLFVQAQTTIAIPPGWALPAGASQVNNMAAYAFVRTAHAGDVVDAQLVAAVGGLQAAVSWVRLAGVAGVSAAVSTFSETAGTSSPALSTAVGSAGDLVLAASLMQTGGTGSSSPTSPIWQGQYGARAGASGPAGPLGSSNMSAFVSTWMYSDETGQAPSVSWTGSQELRYVVAVAFTPIRSPQTIHTTQQYELEGTTVSFTNYLRGMEWRSAVAGLVPALRIYAHPAPPLVLTMQLWRSSDGKLLAERQLSPPGADSWNNAILDTPVPIVAGETYLVNFLIREAGGYVYDPDLLATDLVNGVLTALAGRGMSNADFNIDTYPTQASNVSHFTEVLFEAAAAPPPAVTPLALTSSVAATTRLATGGAAHAGIFAAVTAVQHLAVSAATVLGLVSRPRLEVPVVAGGASQLGLLGRAVASKGLSSSGTATVAVRSTAAVTKRVSSRGTAAFAVFSTVRPVRHLVVGAFTALGLVPRGTAQMAAGPARIRVTSREPTIRITSAT